MVLSEDVLPGDGQLEVMLVLRLIALLILTIWLVLVILGKGGFAHLLLLNGLGIAMVDVMTVVRTRMTEA